MRALGPRVAAAEHHLPLPLVRAIVLFPIIVAPLYAALLWGSDTRSAALWLLWENRPVELVSFFALLAAGLLGLWLAWQARRQGESRWIVGFYALFSAGLLVIAMEEIAWGQHFLHFDSPSIFLTYNKQGELTLHNLGVLHGHSEYFRVAFAVGGCLGLFIGRWPRFRKIAVPAVLTSWFVVISLFAGLDLYLDFQSISPRLDWTIGVFMSEVVEMLIGLAAFLYIWLKARTDAPLVSAAPMSLPPGTRRSPSRAPRD